jgi:hypothetical protein
MPFPWSIDEAGLVRLGNVPVGRVVGPVDLEVKDTAPGRVYHRGGVTHLEGNVAQLLAEMARWWAERGQAPGS